ncbi:2,3-diaminopropionate biosynthesis protein SbnB [Micromonospora sp. DT231]|uniref:2,3-diaminopropionate biosynthesis protein SbnB n=1 Tax=Micromonospora sp. DT231 TaxID=3416526 RepID=UPI003CE82A82
MLNFDVVPGRAVRDILAERKTVLEIVREAYLAHGAGRTNNPDSYFLRFDDKPADRIIALPARTAVADADIAGIKWIASFPENVEQGLPRASAVLVLNDMANGYPYALLEAAGISAARTAASIALAAAAAQATHPGDGTVGFFGAGVIARTILVYLAEAGVDVRNVLVCDPHPGSAASLVAYAESLGMAGRAVPAAEALAAGTVVTATNTGTPHLDRAPEPGQVYLNVSLRDFTPEVIIAAQNVVDDVDHCLKANTSPHLAEQRLGHREFITGTIPGLLAGEFRLDPARGVVISPFGLGVLDLAVGHWVHGTAVASGTSIRIAGFFGEEQRW